MQIALQEFLVGVSFMVIQTVVNAIDVTASAGVGVAEKVCAFIMLVPSAFSQSMSAFVAQNIGAFCVRVPMVFLMSNLPNTTLFHIGLATPISSIVQIVLCVVFMLYTGQAEKKNVAH